VSNFHLRKRKTFYKLFGYEYLLKAKPVKLFSDSRILLAQRALLILFIVVLFLPFIDKAFHIDDPLYLWAARQIQHHALDFFGFSVNWYGRIDPFASIINNPPLFSYYLAAVAYIFGWSEAAMHLAVLVPLVALVLGTYQLATVMQAKPIHASLIAVCTPVFVLSGTTVMVDMAMTAFYVWAIYLWVRGLEVQDGKRFLIAAALLIAASGLTKYFGVTLMPLLAVYALWRRLPFRRWLPFLLIPLTIFILYQWGTNRLYGVGLITDAANYALTYRRLSLRTIIDAILLGLSFTGGGILIPLAIAPKLLTKRGWLLSFGGFLSIGILLLILGSLDRYNDTIQESWLTFGQLAIFVAVGGGLLAAAFTEFWRERDAKSLLLFCWVIGTFIFAGLINWSVSGRNILPIAPAAGIIIARKLELKHTYGKGIGWGGFTLSLAPVLIIAILVTMADYRYANEVRSTVQRISRRHSPKSVNLWFQGHWGFQYYLEQAGGKAIDYKGSGPKAGDIIVNPSFGSNILVDLDETYLDTLEELYTSPLGWLSVLDPFLGAGFYSSVFGPLPYAFGVVKPEIYRVQRLRSVNPEVSSTN
jgi:4-amino-4-deoxy-L-arabinose transferase-like glycosyltransferase